MPGSSTGRTRFHPRIVDVAERATTARERFEEPDDPDERAIDYLREGAGEAIAIYAEARTADDRVRFPEPEYRRLEGAMNDWLELYTRCYGVEIDARFTLPTAAELLVRTENVRDVAQLLTDVPSRR
jgi:hypothetical protein